MGREEEASVTEVDAGCRVKIKEEAAREAILEGKKVSLYTLLDNAMSQFDALFIEKEPKVQWRRETKRRCKTRPQKVLNVIFSLSLSLSLAIKSSQFNSRAKVYKWEK